MLRSRAVHDNIGLPQRVGRLGVHTRDSLWLEARNILVQPSGGSAAPSTRVQ